MKYSDTERRSMIVDHAVPAARSPNSHYMDLRIALYDTDGHSAVGPVGNAASHVVLNCSDDLELVAEFAKLVSVLRQRQLKAKRAA
jgi:hypothetical protein